MERINQSPRYSLDTLPYDISKKELLTYFSFSEEAKDYINTNCRLSSYRIALGIQIGSYRLIGRPQANIEDTPNKITRFVARDLGHKITEFPITYTDRTKTLWAHQQMAREYLQLRIFTPSDQDNLFEYLIREAPDPGHLPYWIIKAEMFLGENKYAFPPIKLLRRLVLSARHLNVETIMNKILDRIGESKIKQLEELLDLNEENKNLWSELTNKKVYISTPNHVIEILKRIRTIRSLDLDNIDFSFLSKEQTKFLAHQGFHASGKKLRNYGHSRRIAVMVMSLKELKSELIDVSIQMHDEIISKVFLRGRVRSEKNLKRNKKTVYEILSMFRIMCRAYLDYSLSPSKRMKKIQEVILPLDAYKLLFAAERLTMQKGTESLQLACDSFTTINKYLPDMLETIKISSSSKSDPLLTAASYYVRRKNENKQGVGKLAPLAFIQENKWKMILFDEFGNPKTKPWTLCLADRLRKSFRQGSLEIEGASQYKSFSKDLISWDLWRTVQLEKDPALPYSSDARTCVDDLSRAIRGFSNNYDGWKNETSESGFLDNKLRLHLRKFDKIEIPESAQKVSAQIRGKMPKGSLSEILADIDALTGFSSHFTRLSTGKAIERNEGLKGQTLYAVLLSSACNIPLSKMADNPNFSIESLETVKDDCIRPQTLQAATSALVEFYSHLPLSQLWGEGETSSSDGQGFIAEGRPLGATYNRKRFGGNRRGFMIYTHIFDNYAPFYSQVIPSAAREATYVLDGLLYHGTSLLPREHYTDSHGYTDVVFAFTYLLGFRLAPRIANIPDLTLWYGKGHEISCKELFDGEILLKNIAGQWKEIQRIMYTIHSGTTKASQIIRKLSSYSRKHSLFKAFRDLGRLVRTRHMLEMASNNEYKRRIHQGLNKGESKNALARDIRFARQGKIREREPEAQLNVATTLNLVVLCVALWNTVHMQRAIRSLRKEGYIIDEADLQFRSPFMHDHINLYGQFKFKPAPELDILTAEREFEPL